MTKSVQPYLILIRKALNRIADYRPATEAEFLAQPMVQDAILMRLQEIGELLSGVRRIDADLFTDPDHDSWRKMIGLRNVISHGYEGIDLEQIWQILVEELPSFAETIEAATNEA